MAPVPRQEHTPRELMIAYLLMKLKENDLHAVADAAMDIREMDAYELGRKAVK